MAAVDKGRGDSGSINFILAAALRDAGFKPEIILLNPRSAERLPLTHATDRIRTFVLRTKLKSGETVYLDATDLHSDVNVLPTQLLVDHARLYSPEHPFENWINLSSPAQSVVLSQITARLTEEGELECTETDTETNQAAYDLSRRYSRSENHDTFVQEYEQRAGITISELTVDGLNTAKARMKLNFRKPVDSGGDFLYICPTIVPFIEKNPFTSQKRQLPVEFSYPYRYRHHRFADAARRLHRGGTAQIATPVRLQRRHRLHDAVAATGSADAMPVRIRPVAHHLPRHRIHRPERILRIRHGHVQQPDRS